MRAGRLAGVVGLIALVPLACALSARAGPDPAAAVDPLIGTVHKAGDTFPGAVVPFGMVQFSPVTTSGAGRGGYSYGDTSVRGFALTRLSGAGCTNAGDLPIMPLTAPFSRYGSSASRFSHAREHASPGAYSVTLDSGVGVDLTATTRTGFATLRFPGAKAWLALDVGGNAAADQDGIDVQVVGATEVRGTETTLGFCGGPARLTLHFVARFDRPIASAATWNEDGQVEEGVLSRRTVDTGGALLGFDLDASRTLRVKVGISYVSVDNAALNLDAEDPGWDGARVAAAARARWNELLGTVRVEGGSPVDRRVFATALYHSLIHPTVAQDVNGQFVGRDQVVRTAVGYVRYTNVSAWDAYRTQLPLLALVAPRVAGDLVQSLVAGAQEQGRLSKWLLGSWETGVMVGDSADPIVAGAYAFGARRFDTGGALRAMIKGASVAQPGPYVYPSNAAAFSNRGDPRPDRSYVERPGLDQYLRRGYVPSDHGEGFLWGPAATTLEYAIDDFALSRFALATGQRAQARPFAARSGSWRKLLDPRTRFIEPRRADGSFPRSASHTSQDGFVEGNATQYTWLVPHDVAGLVQRVGGAAAVRARLDRFFRRLNTGQSQPYAWLGNEPSFGTPWLYLWAGAPWRTQSVVERARRTLFRAGPAGLPGDDDLGALSAWYVWSALGLYPAIPGVGGFVVGTPLFPKATVRWNGGTLTIHAAGRGPYVRRVSLDGEPQARTWLTLAQLRGTRSLDFALARSPQRWGAASAPPSFSAVPAPAASASAARRTQAGARAGGEPRASTGGALPAPFAPSPTSPPARGTR